MVNENMYYGQPENTNEIAGFFVNYLNSESSGAWVTVIIGISFSIPFFALLTRFNPRKAFAAASFNSLMVTVMLSALGIPNIGFYFALTAVAVTLSLVINNDGGGVAA